MRHILAGNCLDPESAKIEAIIQTAKPTRVLFSQFLNGFVTYLLKIMPKLSDVVEPIRRRPTEAELSSKWNKWRSKLHFVDAQLKRVRKKQIASRICQRERWPVVRTNLDRSSWQLFTSQIGFLTLLLVGMFEVHSGQNHSRRYWRTACDVFK